MQKLLVSIIVFGFFVSPVLAQKYSSGKSTSASPSKTTGSKPSSGPGNASRYSGPSNSSNSSSNAGSKPKTNSGYDSAAAYDQKRQESQRAFAAAQKAKQPVYVASASSSSSTPQYKPAYMTPNGKPVAIEQKDATYWKGRLDQSKIERRDERARFAFGTQYDYYSRRPRLFYDDHIDSNFYYWLRDQPISVQSRWAYNHRLDMDSRRYSDLMLNAALAATVMQMEQQNMARDSYWAPPGMDPDLMLSNSYVQSVSVANYGYTPNTTVVYRSGHIVIWSIFFLALTGIILFAVIRSMANS